MPTCCDCIHAAIQPGSPMVMYFRDGSGDPGVPDSLEHCLQVDAGKVSLEMLESLEYDMEKLPAACNGFEPRLLGKCGVCKQEIDHPAYLPWPWHGRDYWSDESFPCCGPECAGKAEIDYQQNEALYEATREEQAEYGEAAALDFDVDEDALGAADEAFMRRTYFGLEG